MRNVILWNAEKSFYVWIFRKREFTNPSLIELHKSYTDTNDEFDHWWSALVQDTFIEVFEEADSFDDDMVLGVEVMAFWSTLYKTP